MNNFRKFRLKHQAEIQLTTLYFSVAYIQLNSVTGI